MRSRDRVVHQQGGKSPYGNRSRERFPLLRPCLEQAPRRTLTLSTVCCLRCADHHCTNLVGIPIRRGAPVFQPTAPAVIDRADRNSDGGSPVRDSVRELMDRLGLMQTSQPLLVVRTIDADVLSCSSRILADLVERGLVATRPQSSV